MSSINQLVSEIAHSVKQPDSVPVRRAIKLAIIHARNNLIRKSYSNHNYIDKVLQQRYRASLMKVVDGDLNDLAVDTIETVLRTIQEVPKPVRFTNNLPFSSVRTTGYANAVDIPFVKESTARFYNYLPGFCPNLKYDYINGYVYIFIPKDSNINNLKFIVIESVFEYPHLIPIETYERIENHEDDNDEFLLPEDMIDDIKKIVLETWQTNVVRDTNEIPTENIVK